MLKSVKDVDEADVHGHSGGGVNGRFVVAVNGHAALGMGVDPDAGIDDLKAAAATDGIVVDTAVHNYFNADVRELTEQQALEERGIALAWIDVYRLKSELCVNDGLTEAAQAQASPGRAHLYALRLALPYPRAARDRKKCSSLILCRLFSPVLVLVAG